MATAKTQVEIPATRFNPNRASVATGDAKITFRMPQGPVAFASVKMDGNKFETGYAISKRELAKLVKWAKDHGIEG